MKKLLTCLMFALFLTSFSIEKVNAQYCTPVVTNCTFESITNVTFSNLNVNSSCEGGYILYDGDTSQVTQGQTYQLSVTIAPDANEYITVWIDWNGNELFTDPGEEYIIAVATGVSGPFTVDVTVPGSSVTGNTRMRVMLRWDAVPTSCANYTYGEVEDYILNIQGAVLQPEFVSSPSTHDFGNVNLGNSESQLFSFTNNGGGTLTITNSAIVSAVDGLSIFDLSDTNTYPKSLASGEFMYVTVSYNPTTVGLDSAKLTVTDDVTDAVNEIPLYGTGIQGNFGGNGQAGDNQYFFANSTSSGSGSPSQPTFDLRSTAGATLLCEDGVASVPVTAGSLDDGRWDLLAILPVDHAIKFFGSDYTGIYVNTNGVIGFSAITAGFTVPASIPTASGPIAAIYAIWADLNMAYTNIANRISYEVTADEVIITYHRAGFWTNGGTTGDFPDLYMSFQVIISHMNTPTQNSRIIVQYNWDETGTDVQSEYTDNGLSNFAHIIGLQGSNNPDRTLLYRNRHNTAFVGPIFGSNLALAMGPDDTALPVDLIAFNANVDRNNVELSWTTAWEENNARFDVQRRIANSDANWTIVGTVQGHGTTYEQQNYNFSDKNLVTGSYEYRLVQYDFDGNSNADFNLSQTVEVGIPSNYDLAQNYPNPFNPTTKINFQIPVEGMVKLSIFDLSGREVATLVNEALTPGYYIYDFNASNFASGVYFYRITSNNFVMTKRMVLVK